MLLFHVALTDPRNHVPTCMHEYEADITPIDITSSSFVHYIGRLADILPRGNSVTNRVEV